MPNKVKYYRELKGWTQERLAKESGVSRNTISLIETHSNTNITYNIMEKIAVSLEKTITEIFFKQ